MRVRKGVATLEVIYLKYWLDLATNDAALALRWGRDQRSSLLEGWGEGVRSIDRSQPLTRIASDDAIRPLPLGEVEASIQPLTIAVSGASRLHTFTQPLDRRLGAALAVGNAERIEADFDDAEGAQDHRRIDVAHMGDAERLA